MPPVQPRDLPNNGSVPPSPRVSPKLPDELKPSTAKASQAPSAFVSPSPSPKRSDAFSLLNDIWGESTGQHFLASRDPKSGLFQSHPVANAHVAAEKAMVLDAHGLNVYFAPASFLSAQDRKETNVAKVKAFWLDIDCGQDKADKGQGYPTQDIARQALINFCNEIGFPQPTHWVNSGNGLHVYWVLKQCIGPTLWKDSAQKLKALLKGKGILADPSRTADIASLMRVPGTHNRKAEPALLVKLWEGEHEI